MTLHESRSLSDYNSLVLLFREVSAANASTFLRNWRYYFYLRGASFSPPIVHSMAKPTRRDKESRKTAKIKFNKASTAGTPWG
jgi:hypothetical protein